MEQKVIVKVQLDDSRATKGLKNLDKSVTSASGGASLLKKSLIGLGSAAVAGAIVKVSKEALNLASALEESENAISVVFGSGVDTIREFGRTAVETVGLATAEFNQLTIATGSLLKNAGLPLDEVAEKTINLTQRAADLASVFNTDVEESTMALGAALRGESEPARRFGITLSDAAVQAQALKIGLVENKKEITEAVKIQARYSLILEQSNDKAGDFANTQSSFSNQLKIASANTKQLGAAIGQNLLPAASSFLNNALNPLISGLTKWIDKSNSIRRALKEIDTDIQELGESTKLNDRIVLLKDQYEDLGKEIDKTKELLEDAEGIAETNFWTDRLNDQRSAQSKLNSDLERAKKMLEEIKTEEKQTITETENLTVANEDLSKSTRKVYANSLTVAEAMEELNKRYADISVFEYEPVKDEDVEKVYSLQQAFEALENQQLSNIDKAKSFAENLILSAEFAGTLKQGYVDSFGAIGEALINGEDASKSFANTLAKSGLQAVASVLEALAIEATVRSVAAIAARDFSGAALWGSAAALAGTSAGAVKAIEVPELAEGGIVPATPGGRIVKVAEAGQAEAIIPLDKMGMSAGQTIINNYVTNVAGSIWQEEALAGMVTGRQRMSKRGF